MDRFSLFVRNLDTDKSLARYTVNPNRFGLQGKTKVVNESGYARIFNTRVGLELERRNDGALRDVNDPARDIKLFCLFLELGSQLSQLDLFLLDRRFGRSKERR